MACWRRTANGVVLAIRVQPGARANRIDGIFTAADGAQALKVCVTAPPDRGKANKAAIALLAKHFGFAKSSLGLVSGTTSRNKQIMIAGVAEQIARALVAGLDELEAKRIAK